MTRRIAISTGGGDAPGLNAVIRATVLSALNRGWEVCGIRKGYAGLLGEDAIVPLDRNAVRGITHLGGTILGTTNRGNPFEWQARTPDGTVRVVDRSDEVIEAFRRHGFDALIAIGGDGSLHIANELAKKGLPVIGVPKTIDNDLAATQVTFGFHTAVQTASDAIDKLHSTAESHERVMVVEVMGRHTGWIALFAGVSATADVILIPEIPFSFDEVADKVIDVGRVEVVNESGQTGADEVTVPRRFSAAAPLAKADQTRRAELPKSAEPTAPAARSTTEKNLGAAVGATTRLVRSQDRSLTGNYLRNATALSR